MAKSRKRRRKSTAARGSCRRVRVCGKTRMICRDRKGRIKSNTPARRKKRR